MAMTSWKNDDTYSYESDVIMEARHNLRWVKRTLASGNVSVSYLPQLQRMRDDLIRIIDAKDIVERVGDVEQFISRHI